MRDNFELLVLNLEPVHLYQGTVEFRRCAPLQCATQTPDASENELIRDTARFCSG